MPVDGRSETRGKSRNDSDYSPPRTNSVLYIYLSGAENNGKILQSTAESND